jgi:hypothetical protein
MAAHPAEIGFTTAYSAIEEMRHHGQQSETLSY